ncbi:hypothetical protein [Bradyrhizobium elkanii]|uniref:hypothetical protein n=1 Tax=Bradyrhizobium elkanii TaxID=29448 RepID=UPI0020A060E6|nr:hypothetical protein [Bradyrhizobium elkanii]MCP1969773.1 hypothetical protein [Bradyrhizobium elkanii]MCS4108719.1 hypothetical protein [Bradyrhizobium elkanii]
MKRLLSAVLLMAASPAWAGGYMGFEKPCPDQNPKLRKPRSDETCDYVKIIKRCDGDLSERVFKVPRHPSKLMSENGPDHPRRLVCHHDDE